MSGASVRRTGERPSLPLDLVHPRNLLTWDEWKPPELTQRLRHAIARRLRQPGYTAVDSQSAYRRCSHLSYRS